MSSLSINITYRTSKITIHAQPHSTLASLSTQIANITGVPRELQKLVFNSRVLSKLSQDAVLEDVGIENGAKLVVLGSTRQDVDRVKEDELKAAEIEAIRQRQRERAARATSTLKASSSSSTSRTSFFSTILPFPQQIPCHSARAAMLDKLAHDPSIVHLMEKYELRVGQLTELHPHTSPNLLGLNENAGQVIRLRLLTDDLEGCRVYSEVRRVLVHELTHNRWGDHDDSFKAFNSEMLREAASWDQKSRGQRLGGNVERWSDNLEVDLSIDNHATHVPGQVLPGGTGGHVLGSSSDSTSLAGDNAGDRRRRIREAAEARLRNSQNQGGETDSDGKLK